ncbi:hypothetical protein GLF_2312 [Gluconobacter frateurii NBRC 101659]|nr:hypothetical protein GLF_2312 [Gluconobacter frateurii NBRC 101659]
MHDRGPDLHAGTFTSDGGTADKAKAGQNDFPGGNPQRENTVHNVVISHVEGSDRLGNS